MPIRGAPHRLQGVLGPCFSCASITFCFHQLELLLEWLEPQYSFCHIGTSELSFRRCHHLVKATHRKMKMRSQDDHAYNSCLPMSIRGGTTGLPKVHAPEEGCRRELGVDLGSISPSVSPDSGVWDPNLKLNTPPPRRQCSPSLQLFSH